MHTNFKKVFITDQLCLGVHMVEDILFHKQQLCLILAPNKPGQWESNAELLGWGMGGCFPLSSQAQIAIHFHEVVGKPYDNSGGGAGAGIVWALCSVS